MRLPGSFIFPIKRSRLEFNKPYVRLIFKNVIAGIGCRKNIE